MYTPAFEAEVQRWAETLIPAARLAHVRGVVQTADNLAARYAPEERPRARLAGWMHDAAKHWDDNTLLDYAESHDLPITPGDRAVPMLLHGVVGYALAAARFGLDDAALMNACTNHTTGAPDMPPVAQIVLLADLIEPGRSFAGVEAVRAAAQRSLPEGVFCAVRHTLRHLLERQRYVDPRGVLLYNQLLQAGLHCPEK